jgi:hypothetical protein
MLLPSLELLSVVVIPSAADSAALLNSLLGIRKFSSVRLATTESRRQVQLRCQPLWRT